MQIGMMLGWKVIGSENLVQNRNGLIEEPQKVSGILFFLFIHGNETKFGSKTCIGEKNICFTEKNGSYKNIKGNLAPESKFMLIIIN